MAAVNCYDISVKNLQMGTSMININHHSKYQIKQTTKALADAKPKTNSHFDKKTTRKFYNDAMLFLGQIVSDDLTLWHGASVRPAAERNRHRCAFKRVRLGRAINC